MNIIPFKGKNTSTHYNLNLLYRKNNIFIMDNHLAAGWCWLQAINVEKRYNLFHIDRHYDLLQSQLDWWIEELKNQNINLTSIQIEDLTNVHYKPKFSPTNESFQLLRWDNYLPIIARLYPNLINSAIFATHKDGDTMDDFEISEVEVYDLPGNLNYWLSDSAEKWIINIDIDYFFTDIDDNYIQLLTDDYILLLAKELKKSLAHIEAITIALSPEMCGGWDKSLRVAKIILDELNINLNDIIQ